jgi:hypothetical protein
MPTLSRLAGYEPAADLKWDGRDMWPVISGAVDSVEPRTIYIPFTTGKAIRHGDWKLIAPRVGAAAKAAVATEGGAVAEDRAAGEGGAAPKEGAAAKAGAATQDSAAGKAGKKARAGQKAGQPKKAKAAGKADRARQAKKELYHLGRDPYEKEDLSDREPERVKELENLLEEMGKGDAAAMPEDLKDFREDPALEEAPPAKAPPADAPRADAPSGEK